MRTWQAREPVALTLRVRHPAWARGPLTVAINGTPVEVGSEPGSYAAIARTWRTAGYVLWFRNASSAGIGGPSALVAAARPRARVAVEVEPP